MSTSSIYVYMITYHYVLLCEMGLYSLVFKSTLALQSTSKTEFILSSGGLFLKGGLIVSGAYGIC